MSQTSVALLFMLMIPLVAREGKAQNLPESPAPSVDCLVVLKSPDPQFEKSGAVDAATVLAHSSSNLNWLVRFKNSDCIALRKASNVERVEKPASVIVTLNDDVTVPQAEIESLGGIVTHKFESISAASVVLPASKITELTSLPAIKRVRKDYSVSATGPAK